LRFICAIGAFVSISRAILSFDPAKSITVRQINARTIKPLSKVQVSMSMWNGTFDIHRPPYPRIELISTVSDSTGLAHFNLPDPLPEHVGIDIGGPRNFVGCSRLTLDSPLEVLKTGLVADYNQAKCGKVKAKLSSSPGEVIIVDRKLRVWDVMRQEIP
jgi:hypothetical protein